MRFNFKPHTTRLIRITVIGLLLLSFHQANAQVLGQDKEGFSTIIIPATNLNIDGANNVISISFSQLQSLKGREKDNETTPTANITALKSSTTEYGEFKVTLSSPVQGCCPVTINYNLEGSAKNGIDYKKIDNSLVIPPGHNSATLEINSINTDKSSENKTVEAILKNGLGYIIETPSKNKAVLTTRNSQEQDEVNEKSNSNVKPEQILTENQCFNSFELSKDKEKLKECIEKAWDIEEANYNKKNKSLLYGIELSGSSRNGLSLIFDNELLANNATANGIIGVHYRKLKRNRKSLDEYIDLKTEIKVYNDNYDNTVKDFKFLVGEMYQKGFISKIYQGKLLRFINIPKPKNKILEIDARLKALENPDSEFDIVPRKTEIDKQLKIVNTILSKVKSINKAHSLPTLGNINEANSLRKILTHYNFKGISKLSDKELITFGEALKDKIFPKINEIAFTDIPSFEFFLSKNGYPNTDQLTNTDFENIRSLFKQFVFYSSKELYSNVSEDIDLANEKLRLLNQAKENILLKLKEYEKNNPSSTGFNEVELKIDIEKHTEKSTWATAEKELFKIKDVLESKKLQLDGISSEDSLRKKTEKLVDLLMKSRVFLSNLMVNQKEKLKIDDKQVHFNKYLFYGKAGFIGKSFLYDFDNGSNALNERIMERNFRGNRFEIGMTFQLKTFNFFGFSISRDYTDNSNILTSTTYKTSTIDNTVFPAIESSGEITALSGPYDPFDQYRISADYVRLIRFKDRKVEEDQLGFNNDLFLSLNPYLRHSFYGNSMTLKPNTTIGLGLHAFNVKKNSIAGGVFVQANDIFDINSESNFDEKINIGLVFKYSLTSVNPK